MIELNGELLKPLDNNTNDGDDQKSKQMELGSVRFDSSVSCPKCFCIMTISKIDAHVVLSHTMLLLYK